MIKEIGGARRGGVGGRTEEDGGVRVKDVKGEGKRRRWDRKTRSDVRKRRRKEEVEAEKE